MGGALVSSKANQRIQFFFVFHAAPGGVGESLWYYIEIVETDDVNEVGVAPAPFCPPKPSLLILSWPGSQA